jgi:hypothetical protein
VLPYAASGQSRFITDYKAVMGEGAKAKTLTTVQAEASAKDGLITFIVRVMGCFFFFLELSSCECYNY